jgi:hypothetical protein
VAKCLAIDDVGDDEQTKERQFRLVNKELPCHRGVRWEDAEGSCFHSAVGISEHWKPFKYLMEHLPSVPDITQVVMVETYAFADCFGRIRPGLRRQYKVSFPHVRQSQGLDV